MLFLSEDEAQRVIGGSAFVGIKKVIERSIYKTRAGTPNVNADFLGQFFLDSSASHWYMAVAVGSGSPANDWKQVTV